MPACEGGAAVAVIGLGYVGIQLAVAFAKRVRVIGYDTDGEKIRRYRCGADDTNEVGDAAVAASGICFTDRAADLAEAGTYIVAVPTPVDAERRPDLSPLRSACETVALYLGPGDLVSFESTVYPGVTEELCMPILEDRSGLRCGEEFSLGYSPERISPGEPTHTLGGVTKVVSGRDARSLRRMTGLYGLILDESRICPASCIRTAEAAKLLENTQRDVLIALANEAARLFGRLGLDTAEVLDCAATKWNFCPVHPGMVGGHCIGVDPYYFCDLAERTGVDAGLVRAARKENEAVCGHIAGKIRELRPGAKRVLVLGATYKENVPDLRNSKALELAELLRERGYVVAVADDLANGAELGARHGFSPVPEADVGDGYEVVVFAVGHKRYAAMDLPGLRMRCAQDPLLVDIGRILAGDTARAAGFRYWSLY